MVDELYPGCPIKVQRELYTHHGIYEGFFGGEHWVLHYSGELGRKSGAQIRNDTLCEFLQEGSLEIDAQAETQMAFSGEEVLERAQSRLGEQSYNLAFNNCEHFVYWCLSGKQKSSQVSRVAMAAGAVVSVGVALGLVAVATQDEEEVQ